MKANAACLCSDSQHLLTHVHTNRHTDVHTYTCRYSCTHTSLLTANGNRQKEASGYPVEISHLIALYLQVASMGFKKEQGLLLRHVVVRIHKAGGAHTALTWWSTLSWWGLGLTATCYLVLQGLKLMLVTSRLIFDKHLLLSS